MGDRCAHGRVTCHLNRFDIIGRVQYPLDPHKVKYWGIVWVGSVVLSKVY